jgi:hypothetical protein
VTLLDYSRVFVITDYYIATENRLLVRLSRLNHDNLLG